MVGGWRGDVRRGIRRFFFKACHSVDAVGGRAWAAAARGKARKCVSACALRFIFAVLFFLCCLCFCTLHEMRCALCIRRTISPPLAHPRRVQGGGASSGVVLVLATPRRGSGGRNKRAARRRGSLRGQDTQTHLAPLRGGAAVPGERKAAAARDERVRVCMCVVLPYEVRECDVVCFAGCAQRQRPESVWCACAGARVDNRGDTTTRDRHRHARSATPLCGQH